MIGDYFGITNQDELSARQLNNLIIEARKELREKIERPTVKRLIRRFNKKQESKTRQGISKDIDQSNLEKNVKKQVTRFQVEEAEALKNRKKTNTKRKNALKSHKKFQDIQQASIDKGTQRHFDTKEIRIEEAKEESKENSELKSNAAKKSDERAKASDKLQERYSDIIEGRRAGVLDNSDASREERVERFEELIEQSKQLQENVEKTQRTPVQFGIDVREAQEKIAEDGRARIQDRFDVTGHPDDHGEEVKETKKEIVAEAGEKREAILDLAEAFFESLIKERRGTDENADTRGREQREANKELAEKAQALLSKTEDRLLREKWERLFQARKTENDNFKDLASQIFHELRKIALEEDIAKSEEINEEKNALFEKRFEKREDREKSITQERTNKVVEERILTPSEEADNLFEDRILELMMRHQTNYDYNHEKDITKFSDERESHPERNPENILTNPPLGFDYQNKQTNDIEKESLLPPAEKIPTSLSPILTYIDDVEYLEEEKANAVESELERKQEKQEELADKRIAEFNKAKEVREMFKQVADEHYEKLYLKKLIEEQNKTAHEKAVELGQFINLFF